jgi:CO dehydrogenase maturation factor
MKPMVLAVCGKGGVGKTTVSAMIARALARRPGLKALLVDADPAGGLGMALALPVKRSVNEVRAQTIREIKDHAADKNELAASLDFRLLSALTERGNLAFLSVGRPEEEGCYCSVNTLLRQAIELLAGQFDLTVIDAEAGIEQVNRKVMSMVDFLLLVSDPTAKGLKVAETIAAVARKIGGRGRAGLILNRIGSGEEARELGARTSLPVIGWLPEDENIRDFDARELSFFDLPDNPAAAALAAALEQAGIMPGRPLQLS